MKNSFLLIIPILLIFSCDSNKDNNEPNNLEHYFVEYKIRTSSSNYYYQYMEPNGNLIDTMNQYGSSFEFVMDYGDNLQLKLWAEDLGITGMAIIYINGGLGAYFGGNKDIEIKYQIVDGLQPYNVKYIIETGLTNYQYFYREPEGNLINHQIGNGDISLDFVMNPGDTLEFGMTTIYPNIGLSEVSILVNGVIVAKATGDRETGGKYVLR